MKIRAEGGTLGQEGGALGQQDVPPAIPRRLVQTVLLGLVPTGRVAF